MSTPVKRALVPLGRPSFRDVIADLGDRPVFHPGRHGGGDGKVLQAGGLVELLGPDGVVPQSDRLFAATEEVVERGQPWIAVNRDTPSAD